MAAASRANTMLPFEASRTAFANPCRMAWGFVRPRPSRLPARPIICRTPAVDSGSPRCGPFSWTSSIPWAASAGYSVVRYSK